MSVSAHKQQTPTLFLHQVMVKRKLDKANSVVYDDDECSASDDVLARITNSTSTDTNQISVIVMGESHSVVILPEYAWKESSLLVAAHEETCGQTCKELFEIPIPAALISVKTLELAIRFYNPECDWYGYEWIDEFLNKTNPREVLFHLNAINYLGMIRMLKRFCGCFGTMLQYGFATDNQLFMYFDVKKRCTQEQLCDVEHELKQLEPTIESLSTR